MIQTKIIIHVGLHKTGTTFIQNEIFSRINNVNYIRPPGTFLQRDIFSKIDRVHFLPGVEDTLCNEPEFKLKIISNKINIIASEGLSGRPYIGFTNADIRFTTADRLKDMFPDAKIIIGIRSKHPWLLSAYGQYLKEGGICSYDVWFKKVFDKRYLDFDSYINYLKKLFNEVYVYKFEDLKENPDDFVKNICNYIGVRIPKYEKKIYRKGWNNKQKRLARFLNKIFKGQLNPNGFLPRFGMFKPSDLINLLQGEYGNDSRSQKISWDKVDKEL